MWDPFGTCRAEKREETANQYDDVTSAAEKKTLFANLWVHRMYSASHAFHIHFTALKSKKSIKESNMKN